MDTTFRLYRIKGAEHIDHIDDLETELEKASEYYVELHDIISALGNIVLNKNYPLDKETQKSIPHKFVCGNSEMQPVGEHYIYGYVNSNEVKEIADWIIETKINTFEGFSLMYDNISENVKVNLYNRNYYSVDLSAEVIFYLYVKPMTEFYFDAVENNNSVVLLTDKIKNIDKFNYEDFEFFIDPVVYVSRHISFATAKILEYKIIEEFFKYKKEIDRKMFIERFSMTESELITYLKNCMNNDLLSIDIIKELINEQQEFYNGLVKLRNNKFSFMMIRWDID